MDKLDRMAIRDIVDELKQHAETLDEMVEHERDMANLSGNASEDDSQDKELEALQGASSDLKNAIDTLETYT